MPVPDFQTLYDFETQIEGAWRTVIQNWLTAASLTAAVQVTRDSTTDTTPRIEIYMVMKSSMNQRRIDGNKLTPNAFEAQLIFQIVTTRPTDNATSPIHGVLRGFLRYNCTAPLNSINAQLPYLDILEMLAGGTTPKMIDAKEQDISQLTFDFKFAIANDAWPS